VGWCDTIAHAPRGSSLSYLRLTVCANHISAHHSHRRHRIRGLLNGVERQSADQVNPLHWELNDHPHCANRRTVTSSCQSWHDPVTWFTSQATDPNKSSHQPTGLPLVIEPSESGSSWPLLPLTNTRSGGINPQSSPSQVHVAPVNSVKGQVD
jgi:hypothetical protein